MFFDGVLNLTSSQEVKAFFVLFLFLLQDNSYFSLVLKSQVYKLKNLIEVKK